MKPCVWIVSALLLLSGTYAQDDGFGFDLSDALDDVAPTPPKPKEQPKPPANPPNSDDGLDLLDAFGPEDPKPEKPKPKPPAPANPGGDGGFNLEDAFGADPDPKPNKPVVPPKGGGGGGSFDDSDLFDVAGGGGGEYKPDRPSGGGGAGGRGGYDDHQGGADQPQESGSGPIAGIVSAVGVALLGAASSYFAYQKKKLCFKLQGGADPERGKTQHGNQSDPQVFSNLLRTS